MIPLRGLIQSVKGWLGKPIAGPDSDPQRFFGPMFALPNPDPILREMGQAERVYYSIAADPHVLGDIRSIRGNFRSHNFRLLVGDDGDPKSLAAQQLCERWLKTTQPNPMADWLEVMWQMSSSFMTGYRAHELVWTFSAGKYLPGQVWDRPNRRFRFNSMGEPLLVSRTNMLGAPLEEPYQFVISRHMPTYDNPYGVATLSSCFWPWTFKTSGWRYFVKYCERHGLPWPVARYPLGTDDKAQDELGEALASMLESAYAVVPEGTGIELIMPKAGAGDLPQQSLIDLANAEMSKAMTGQAMVAELRGTGARAASETALKRQLSIDDSVRDIAAQSMAQIFRWITLFNFGDGIAPPMLEFYQHENAGKDRAETYMLVARMGAKPSRSAMLQELGIPEAEDAADEMPMPIANPTASPAGGRINDPGPGNSSDPLALDLSGIAGFKFARSAGMTQDQAIALAVDAADQAIEDHMIAPVAKMLARFEAEGRTLADFKSALEDLVGAMDDEALREVLDRSLVFAMAQGASSQAA